MEIGGTLDGPQLLWPGKLSSVDQASPPRHPALPFQIVETINSSRDDRAVSVEPLQPTLFDIWEGEEGDTFADGWKNKLIWGDSARTIPSLLDRYSGQVKLIYVDPPFKKGYRFDFIPTMGDSGIALPKKRQSIIEEAAYRDTWGKDLSSFLTMMSSQLKMMRQLLVSDGTLWVHVDDEAGHYVKVLLDEVFGRHCFINQIIWHYSDRIQGNVNRYPDNHNMILVYGRNPNTSVSRVREPLDEPVKRDRRGWDKDAGAIRAKRDVKGKILYDTYTDKGADNVWKLIMDQHVWEIGISGPTQPRNKEYWGYNTQKPLALLRRILESGSQEQDLVADFYCGSGTTAIAANQTNRRWIAGDISRWATHVTRKRFLEEQSTSRCEILNLGKYERKHWQSSTFNSSESPRQEEMLYRYITFVLKLYGAEPSLGMEHIQGKKGNAVVHVGSVDAPITIDEALGCLDECEKLDQRQLHILGWEWEMGLPGLMEEEASRRGIQLSMRLIPSDLIDGADNADVHFWELGHLQVDVSQPGTSKLQRQVALTEFSVSDLPTIPDGEYPKINHWLDLVDYWAIDWNYQGDTFQNQWVSYRTPRYRTLDEISETHRYPSKGRYTVMVKVVDIFGNDTSLTRQIEVGA